jgi:hypothetical protein
MFEAKGIQRYIFASGKLRDVVGASDLVAGLANSDDAADEIGEFWPDKPDFSRRAGGAFCIHSRDKPALALLRAKWRYHILTKLPGLEFVDVIAQAEGDNPLDAMRACFRDTGGIRINYPATVPGLGRPISKIAPLTGRPAVVEKSYGKDDKVLVDAIGLPQRDHADKNQLELVARRFVEEAENWKFPRNYEEGGAPDPDNPPFPFEGEDKRIAVIHADLSGLGALFRNMGSKFTNAEQNFDLAKEIEGAITRAVKAAVACEIVPHAVGNVLPARPVLLGGDDITIIVRADLAIPFTVKLLENIETECKSIGADLGQKALSACAGIAIVGKGTPFLTAYALADDLCLHAKKEVKAAPVGDKAGRKGYASAYSFHIYQHSAHDGYEGTIAENETDASGKPLSANPYVVGDRKAADAVDLIALAKELVNVEGGHGRVREIKSLVSDNLSLAEAVWERWWEVGLKKQEAAMKCLEGHLGDRKFKDGSSGIFDAMLLIDLAAVAKKQAAAVA